ncbi:hypothetical protein, partial [Mesorhizobium sp. M0276]|uniref:hypothetical protein n=1 Tax=Mesorhizobium sp. M0276 TaxID=2956928 RepID=UPI00333C0132
LEPPAPTFCEAGAQHQVPDRRSRRAPDRHALRADDGAFQKVNRPAPPHLQSSRSALDHNQLYQAGENHLIRLGLLKKSFGTVKKGEFPDFDPFTGDFKHSLEVSHLGQMLLREIGMETPFDAEQAKD